MFNPWPPECNCGHQTPINPVGNDLKMVKMQTAECTGATCHNGSVVVIKNAGIEFFRPDKIYWLH